MHTPVKLQRRSHSAGGDVRDFCSFLHLGDEMYEGNQAIDTKMRTYYMYVLTTQRVEK